MTGFVYSPNAKINLGLSILGRNANGYHKLSTVFCSVSLRDRLVISPGTGFRVRVSGAKIRGVNLLTRAGRLLMEKAVGLAGAPRDFTARLDLIKKIPVGAGLGGGSSDGACTLRGLARFWKLSLTEKTLRQLAANLGADVPYFLAGGLARGRGLGDKIFRLANLRPRLWFVLALDAKPLETRRVFDAFDRIGPIQDSLEGEKNVIVVRLAGRADGIRLSLKNDLWPAVLHLRPALGPKRKSLEKLWKRPVALSGSGPTLYSIFTSRVTARRAAKAASRQGIGRLKVVQSLSRRESLGFVTKKKVLT